MRSNSPSSRGILIYPQLYPPHLASCQWLPLDDIGHKKTLVILIIKGFWTVLGVAGTVFGGGGGD